MMIVTADGSMLFETVPRHVGFEATPAYGPASEGKRILVDGVPVASATGANTSAGGTLAAMVQLRDVYAVELQSQLDEIARGLIAAFSETNPDPLDPQQSAGLFTWPGGPGLPADTGVETGLAARIALHANVDPEQGGNAARLRDGVVYDFNPDGNASFSDQLRGFISALDAPRTLYGAGGVPASLSLNTFSANAVSWLEDGRKTAAGAAETKIALMIRSSEALSNLTNVNVDEEMALMLELEQSYAASAKMLQMLDEMLKTLLSVVR